jgi:hypothetical protein
MSELHRIGREPTDDELWQELGRLLIIAQARPNIYNMERVVDVWRAYMRRFRIATGNGRPAA